MRLQGNSGNIRAGGAPNVDGDLVLFRAGANININNAEQAAIIADAASGLLQFRNPNNFVTMRLEGNSGNIRAGGGRDVDGDLLLYRSGVGIDINDAGISAIHADADNGSLTFRDRQGRITLRLEGDGGNLRAGGAPDIDGDLVLFRGGAGIDINDTTEAAIHADAGSGSVSFRNSVGDVTLLIEGDSGNIRLGGAPGVDGDIVIFASGDNIDINDASQATIHLNGDAGDIILRNADCAEEFAVSDAAAILSGAVMVLNDQGLLEPSAHAYDKRVVGVVSGAGVYKPGIVLDRQPGQANRSPIALVGKVYCQVSADHEPVSVGDLLTTSDIPGYAMKASDPGRAFGSVLGKALQPLPTGRGLLPVLIALQ
jgi:hypothetical protein